MVKQYRHVVAFVYKFAHLSYDRGKPRGIQPTERLKQLSTLVNAIYKEQAHTFAKTCLALANEVEQALFTHATVEHPTYGKILAYEIDGFGSIILMDDANVPSLLSLPYLNALDKKSSLYQQTRQFVCSADNPWYFHSKLIQGIGSIHTGRNRVWPISIAMMGLTSENKMEQKRCIDLLASTHADTYFMHESIHINNLADYTRPWFAWANSLCAELFINYYNLFDDQ